MGRRSLPSLVFIIISTGLYLISSSCCNADSPSCGNIQNISCPFKLKGDHRKCDSAFFTQELSCINNHTIFYLLPDKQYYVKSTNYDNLTIRIVDPGLQNSNSSFLSFPSISENDFRILGEFSPSRLNQPITMIDCPSPVKSTRYINVTSPYSSSFSASVLGMYHFYSYTYIVVAWLGIYKYLRWRTIAGLERWHGSHSSRLLVPSYLIFLNFAMQWFMDMNSVGITCIAQSVQQITVEMPIALTPPSGSSYLGLHTLFHRQCVRHPSSKLIPSFKMPWSQHSWNYLDTYK